MILPSSLKAGFSCESFSSEVFGADALVGGVGVAVDREGDDLALEATLLGRLGGELVRAQADLVQLGAGDLPLVGDHLSRDALRNEVVALHQGLREGHPVLLHHREVVGEGDVTHVLDAASDRGVVDAGGDQGRGEVDGLLGGAALAVDGGRRGLDGQAGLEPGVAGDVDPLLAELLHAAGDDILHLGGVDPGALDHLGVGLGKQVGGVDVLVVALLLVAAADRRADCLDDYDLTAAELAVSVACHRACLRSIDWSVNQRVLRVGVGRPPPTRA